MSTKKLLQAAAGSAGGDKVYVEDVFSTFLYDGNSSSQSISNGIDLDGEGGLVWIKSREDPADHALYDTERGSNFVIHSSSNVAQDNYTPLLNDMSNAFTSTGFDLNTATGITNNENYIYASWSFRKQKGFFDVKKVTKSSGSNLVVDFSDLGSLGFVAAKYLGAQDWICWCKGMTSTHHLKFNTTDASSSGNYMTVSGTSVTLIDGAFSSGDSVIYAWADGDDSSAQIFGDDEDEAIIKCGSYTGSGAVGKTITLDFEPQWMLVKNASATTPWVMIDNMRGMPVDGEGVRLLANENAAEVSSASYFAPRADGAEVTLQNTYVNTSSQTYIYIAIRRGPMKEPTAGTDVFAPVSQNTNTSTVTSGFPIDLVIMGDLGTAWSYNWGVQTRLLGSAAYLVTSGTTASSTGSLSKFDSNTGMTNGFVSGGTTGIFEMFRRYPKCFDAVVYSPLVSDPLPRNVHNHNLTVKPELIIIKQTTAVYASRNWAVGAPDLLGVTSSDTLGLNLDVAEGGTGTYDLFDSTQPTATQFTVGYNSAGVGVFGESYVAFLFATLAGISKVGTYTGTGTGTTVDVDCGFSAGARFIIIKRTDSTGDWFVYDSARGIVSGDSPYYFLNTTAVPVNTDYIDPLSSGFQVTTDAAVTSTLNVSGATYLFLAFA